MRIVVDACCWSNARGYGRFTRELLQRLVQLAPEDSFVFLLDQASAGVFSLDAPNVRPKTIRLGTPVTEAAVANGRRSVRDMLALTRTVARSRPDVFFSPSVYSYFPLPLRLRSVVTVHDTIVERFPRLTLPTARERFSWRMKIRLAVHQARLILTVSEYSARQISQTLRIPRSRIRVASEAPAAVYRASESREAIEEAARGVGLPLGAEWFIYVGGFNFHKRVDLLLRAHAKLLSRVAGEGPYLLLVGDATDPFHRNVEALRRFVADAGTASRVIWTGFVPDEDLRHLHTGALALALPSELEGFGLPAVEAAACGTPVIATRASPLPELLEGAGVFVAPGDEEAVERAMWTLWTDRELRASMGARALVRARSLSWKRSARAALDALREAAS